MEEEVLEQEVIQEEPVVESEPEEIPAENAQEPEQPVEETTEEEVPQEPKPEPINVRTNGNWMKIEDVSHQEFEDGKTYHINVTGNCEFMISKDEPKFGMKSNDIVFKKEPNTFLWIKTSK